MDNEDVCPICKTSRYLNPDMKFKVSTECYHKMCESCVDRIFSSGPADCPFANCGKKLRRNKFTDQQFEDITVEKEVNIRKRVQRVFNRGEEHFDKLNEYNDYLEQVEDIVFKLVNDIDPEKTEQELLDYETEHKDEIRAIEQQRVDEHRKQLALNDLDKERRRNRREMELAEEKMDKEMDQEMKREVLRRMATSNVNGDEIMKEVKREYEQRKKDQHKTLRAKAREQNKSTPKSGASVVAQRAIGDNGTPFTPFNGDRQQEYLFKVQDEYYDPLMNGLANDMHYKASGFKLQDAYQQALVQAFFGLGCDIQREKAVES